MPEFDGVLFSDLHLSEDSPELNALFEAFIDRVAGTPEIACLGDLTQYWIGKRHLENDFGQYINSLMTTGPTRGPVLAAPSVRSS